MAVINHAVGGVRFKPTETICSSSIDDERLVEKSRRVSAPGGFPSYASASALRKHVGKVEQYLLKQITRSFIVSSDSNPDSDPQFYHVFIIIMTHIFYQDCEISYFIEIHYLPLLSGSEICNAWSMETYNRCFLFVLSGK